MASVKRKQTKLCSTEKYFFFNWIEKKEKKKLKQNFTLTTVPDEEDESPTLTRQAARCGLETAFAYLEQEGQGECALRVVGVFRFLDTKVGPEVSVQTHIQSFFSLMNCTSCCCNSRCYMFWPWLIIMDESHYGRFFSGTEASIITRHDCRRKFGIRDLVQSLFAGQFFCFTRANLFYENMKADLGKF